MNKELKEIGKLFLEIIDIIEGNSKKENKQQCTDYQDRILRKRSSSKKYHHKFLEKIKDYGKFKNRISESTIEDSLKNIFYIDEERKKVKNKEKPEEIGEEIINSINSSVNLDKYLVIYIIEDFMPDKNLLNLGNVTFGTYKKIIENYNILDMQKPELDETKYDTKITIYNKNIIQESTIKNCISVGTLVESYDPESATKLAKRGINEHLNLIRLIMPISNNMDNRPRISIYEALTTEKAYIINKENGSRYILNPQNSQSRLPLNFLNKNIEKYNLRESFDNALEILSKNPEKEQN